MGWLVMTYQAKIARSGLTAIAAVLALSSTPLAAQETTTPPDPVAEDRCAGTAQPPIRLHRSRPSLNRQRPKPRRRSSAPAETTTTTTADAPNCNADSSATTTSSPRTRAGQQASTGASATSPPGGDGRPMPVPPPSAAWSIRAPCRSPSQSQKPPPCRPMTRCRLRARRALVFLPWRNRHCDRPPPPTQARAGPSAANREYLDSHPDTPESDAPAFARAAAPVMAAAAPGPILKDVPRTQLPPDFDLSRFGPHVRAAYQGPTADNPSLSIKHRLRRAAAMDQQARLDGEAPGKQRMSRPGRTRRTSRSGIAERRLHASPRRSDQPSKPAFQH